MKDLLRLKQFYDTTLLNDLLWLEEERKKVARKGILISASLMLVVIIIAGSLLLLFPDSEDTGSLIVAGIVLLFVIPIAVISLCSKDYVSHFKHEIIQKIINFIDPQLRFEPKEFISESLYNQSGIFRRSYDRYDGEDLVSGEFMETEIKLSELHTEYKTRDSKGRTQWHTIFRGLFFVSDFNKYFQGKTYVLPDFAENLFGQLGQFMQSGNRSYGELVKLEDPIFEKRFVVYASDQIEARYILSTSLMKRITDYKEKYDKQISLAFVDSRIFIAIETYGNLFEPKLFSTILGFDRIQEYYSQLFLAIGIVEDLKLNTRIWSR